MSFSRNDIEEPFINEGLRRTLSNAGCDGIKAALNTVDKQKSRLEDEGLSQKSFFLGTLNVMATTYVLARFPEWLWVMYGVKCLILIPAWWVKVTQQDHGALYILDFCWVVNLSFGVYMVLSACGAVPPSLQLPAFLAFFACSLGPLGWAVIALHNGLAFHNIERIASLFIHMTPTLVAGTVIYYPDELAAAWPGRFPSASELGAVTGMQVFAHGVSTYLAWLVLYAVWLLSVGVDCPARGRNTVFNNLYRKHDLGQLLERRTGLAGLRSHAALYLVIHCFAVSLAFLWAVLCFKLPTAHLGFGLVLVVCAAWNGAGYYEHVFAKKHTQIARQPLTDGDA